VSRHRLIVALAAVLVGLLAAGPTRAANISFFNNATYADPFEAGNMRATLVALGHTVTDFTGITAADWTAAGAGGSIIVLPEMENSDLNTDLVAADRTAIGDYVTGGGCLMQANYFVSNSSLPNAVFGYNLAQTGNLFAATNLDAGEAAGTPFAGGPAVLPASNAVEGVDSTSLPAGALNLYHDGTNTSVFAADFGAGHYIYLGFDWFEQPTPADWETVTGNAVALCGPGVVPVPGSSVLLLSGFVASGLVRTVRRRRMRG
jgi:hypothetical protein